MSAQAHTINFLGFSLNYNTCNYSLNIRMYKIYIFSYCLFGQSQMDTVCPVGGSFDFFLRAESVHMIHFQMHFFRYYDDVLYNG